MMDPAGRRKPPAQWRPACAGAVRGYALRMSQRPVKRSLTLHGHRTSVSLEDDFWQGLQEIAAAEQRPLAALAAEIDAARDPATGLATAIRLHVLRHFRNRAPSTPS